jgi:hypothetical protein
MLAGQPKLLRNGMAIPSMNRIDADTDLIRHGRYAQDLPQSMIHYHSIQI